MRSPLTLIPSYGRNYKSESEAEKAFDSNEDFIVEDYPFYGYINKAECESEGIESVIIKYRKTDDGKNDMKIKITRKQVAKEEEAEVSEEVKHGIGILGEKLYAIGGYIRGLILKT